MPDARARYRKASTAREVLSGGLLPAPARIVSPSTRPRTTRPPRVSDVCDSLDHLIRAQDQFLRNGEPDRPGGLAVDRKRHSRRLLDRQLARLCALEDLVHVGCGALKIVQDVLSVTDQAA